MRIRRSAAVLCSLLFGFSLLVLASPASATITIKVGFDDWQPPAGINSSAVKSDIINRVRSNFAFSTAINIATNCNTPGDISVIVSNRRTDDQAWGEVVNRTRAVAWGGEFNTSLPAAGFTNVTTFGRAISGTIGHEAGHLLNATHVVSDFTAKMQVSSAPAHKALTDRHFTPGNQSNISRSVAAIGGASGKEGSVLMIRGVGSASVPGYEDSNVDVTITMQNLEGLPIQFGYINDSGGFMPLFEVPSGGGADKTVSFFPGEIVEFAVQDAGGFVHSAIEEANMSPFGPIPAPMSYEPMVSDGYWTGFDIQFMTLAVQGSLNVTPNFAGDGMTKFTQGVPALDEFTAVILSLILAGYALYLFNRRRRGEQRAVKA